MHGVLEVAETELDVVVFQSTSCQIDVAVANIGDGPTMDSLF